VLDRAHSHRRISIHHPGDAVLAALDVAICQTCYATGENHERAVMGQRLGKLDLEGW